MATIKAPEMQQRELIPAGNYVAICYKMLQIGTVDNVYAGVTSKKPMIRVGWELSDELKVFKDGEQPKPYVIDKEYTFFMGDNANLRKDLQSWRGSAFTDKEAADFDLAKLVGAPCLLNIIHKKNEAGTKSYENIAGITPLPKSTPKPKPFNKPQILAFDDWDEKLFESLPAFISDKIKTSTEYNAMRNPEKPLIDDKGYPKDLPPDFYEQDDSETPPF